MRNVQLGATPPRAHSRGRGPLAKKLPWRVAVALVSVSLTLVSAAACGAGRPPLLFVSDRDGNLELYSVELGGEDQRNLTNTGLDEFSPVVSPDGKLVAFLSGTGENVALEVMQIDGEERLRLTSGPGRHRSHRWSPRQQPHRVRRRGE